MGIMLNSDTVSISVIIPVYNTPSAVLSECLDSILTQNFESYEVICVDDCSQKTDTFTILDSYKKVYDNLRVIYLKNNMGAAYARNTGLSQAVGKYVIFLDADDLFSGKLLRTVYSKAQNEAADICLFEHSILEAINGEKNISSIATIDIDKVGRDNEMFISSITASGWNRLCRKEYLEENKIKFQNLKSDNDTYFSLMTLLCAQKISVVNDPTLFFYRNNTDFQISKNMNPLNLWKAIKKTKLELARRGIDKYSKAIDVYTILAGIMEMRGGKNAPCARKFYDAFKIYLKKTNIKFDNVKIRLYQKMWLEQEFDNRWYDLIGDYYHQLTLNTNIILDILKGKKQIYIWGNGDRGKAFCQWAQEHTVIISGICDQRNEKNYELNAWGIRLVHCEIAKKEYGFIVASNHAIYNALCNELRQEQMLDLEDYCPL